MLIENRKLFGWILLVAITSLLFLALCFTIIQLLPKDTHLPVRPDTVWFILALYWGVYTPVAIYEIHRVMRWSGVF